MKELRIHLFGEPRARFGEGPLLCFPTEKTLELLAFAALNRAAPIPREHLASALRCDTTDQLSRRALSTDIWRLRRLITEAGEDSEAWLVTDRRAVALSPTAPLWLDVAAFEAAVHGVSGRSGAGISGADAEALARAVALFENDLLANLDCEWCFILRERLRAKHHAALDQLIECAMAADNWAQALAYADRLIEADPLLEHAHRAAMQCHFLMGNRAAAIRQYARCADLLDRELGVAPSDETQRMCRGLLGLQPDAGTLPGRPLGAVMPMASPASIAATALSRIGRDRPLTDQLSMALSNLGNARALIENVDSQLRRGAPV